MSGSCFEPLGGSINLLFRRGESIAGDSKNSRILLVIRVRTPIRILVKMLVMKLLTCARRDCIARATVLSISEVICPIARAPILPTSEVTFPIVTLGEPHNSALLGMFTVLNLPAGDF